MTYVCLRPKSIHESFIALIFKYSVPEEMVHYAYNMFLLP
jgi:hypothetical protein